MGPPQPLGVMMSPVGVAFPRWPRLDLCTLSQAPSLIGDTQSTFPLKAPMGASEPTDALHLASHLQDTQAASWRGDCESSC
jgi:hypothetical protein